VACDCYSFSPCSGPSCFDRLYRRNSFPRGDFHFRSSWLRQLLFPFVFFFFFSCLYAFASVRFFFKKRFSLDLVSFFDGGENFPLFLFTLSPARDFGKAAPLDLYWVPPEPSPRAAAFLVKKNPFFTARRTAFRLALSPQPLALLKFFNTHAPLRTWLVLFWIFFFCAPKTQQTLCFKLTFPHPRMAFIFPLFLFFLPVGELCGSPASARNPPPLADAWFFSFFLSPPAFPPV